MPGAKRYILPWYLYHPTHRCGDRRFLFRLAKDRNGYGARLRGPVVAVKASLQTYNITSNHAHLLVYAEVARSIAELLQQAAGEFARDYNRRKKRGAAFLEGRRGERSGRVELVWIRGVDGVAQAQRAVGYRKAALVVESQRHGRVSEELSGVVGGSDHQWRTQAAGAMDRIDCRR